MHTQWAEFINHSMEWIKNSGWLGAGWFIVIYTLTCVFFLPGSVLTVGAGAIYGFWFSTLLVTVSNTVGAIINFLTSRYLARSFVARKLTKSRKIQAFERALNKQGWQIIFLSRISPIVPHSLVSYAAGLTNMSFWRFVVASWFGFIPISAAYSYAGAVLGSFARTTAGVRERDPLLLFFYIVGGIATVAVTLLITRAATSALKTRVDSADENGETPTTGKSDPLPPFGEEVDR